MACSADAALPGPILAACKTRGKSHFLQAGIRVVIGVEFGKRRQLQVICEAGVRQKAGMGTASLSDIAGAPLVYLASLSDSITHVVYLFHDRCALADYCHLHRVFFCLPGMLQRLRQTFKPRMSVWPRNTRNRIHVLEIGSRLSRKIQQRLSLSGSSRR